MHPTRRKLVQTAPGWAVRLATGLTSPRRRAGLGTWIAVLEKTEAKACYLIVQDWLAEYIVRGTLLAGARLTVAGVAPASPWPTPPAPR